MYVQVTINDTWGSEGHPGDFGTHTPVRFIGEAQVGELLELEPLELDELLPPLLLELLEPLELDELPPLLLELLELDEPLLLELLDELKWPKNAVTCSACGTTVKGAFWYGGGG